MLGIICPQDKIGRPKSGGNQVLFRSLTGYSGAYSAVMENGRVTGYAQGNTCTLSVPWLSRREQEAGGSRYAS